MHQDKPVLEHLWDWGELLPWGMGCFRRVHRKSILGYRSIYGIFREVFLKVTWEKLVMYCRWNFRLDSIRVIQLKLLYHGSIFVCHEVNMYSSQISRGGHQLWSPLSVWASAVGLVELLHVWGPWVSNSIILRTIWDVSFPNSCISGKWKQWRSGCAAYCTAPGKMALQCTYLMWESVTYFKY